MVEHRRARNLLPACGELPSEGALEDSTGLGVGQNRQPRRARSACREVALVGDWWIRACSSVRQVLPRTQSAYAASGLCIRAETRERHITCAEARNNARTAGPFLELPCQRRAAEMQS